MRNKPDTEALLQIAEQVLRDRIIPNVDKSVVYDARMIANALAISQRQLQAGDLTDAFQETLETLMGTSGDVERLTRDLAARIRAGDAPDGTLGALKDITLAKLGESNPRYLARVLSSPS